MSSEEPESEFKRAYDLMVEGRDLDTPDIIFNNILDQDKDSATVLFYLSSLNMKKGKHALALLLSQEVLKLKPDFVEAINNCGFIYKQMGLVEEARIEFSKAVELAKKENKSIEDLCYYYTNLGSMYIGNGTPEYAISLLNKAIDLNPEFDIALWNRALANLEIGNYEAGFNEYDFGKRTERCKDRNYLRESLPFWDGSAGKTVVIYGEQGIGDELMFATMIPDAMKDCNVIIDAHPRLADMFRASFPTIPVYGTRKTEETPWAEFHNIDAKLAMGSLGKFYRKTESKFPKLSYLKPNPILIDKYKERLSELSSRPKIGISWKGGTKATNKNERFIPLDLWLPLFDLDVDFISLQYQPEAQQEIDEFTQKYGRTITHWKSTLDDYDETAGLVSNLDYIISVPQSVIHLNGAIGKTPTIQLCPKKAMWQMGPYGKNMPWYSNVENIWKDESDNWDTAINKAKEILCRLYPTPTAT